ncbi:hypothetical protein [Microbacterium dauci]|uniref:Uncharacterized protein n=1 Tax=Microbacterium dauci TaxID=3048008 RepID=A0ABT6ZAF2_9MICO|nr:hypothetical protein [Microbacterium sp. LX3-4]MDJ1113135.1 hypothetical protein [Microbacterium sp. LX3-4]
MSNILDIQDRASEGIVVREERSVWVGLVVSVVAMIVYGVIMSALLRSTPIEQINWFPLMGWTLGISLVVSLMLTAAWAMIAEAGWPRGLLTSDERDRDIARMGDRVGQAFLVLGGLGAIFLCAADAAPFWIAHSVFAGFALSSIIGSVARVIAYRRGLA